MSIFPVAGNRGPNTGRCYFPGNSSTRMVRPIPRNRESALNSAPSRRRLLVFATLVLLAVTSANSQLAHEGPAKAIALSRTLPAYDVVSVTQNNSNNLSSRLNIHDGIFTATNVPLDVIIEFAYDINEDLILGLSGPVRSAHFDIEAKVLPQDGAAPPKLTDMQMQAMIIPLLADRFHLKAHLQLKTLPVYNLVIARGGPKFKLDPVATHGGGWTIKGSNTEIVLTGKSNSIAELADALSDPVHRQVVDKTGLTGNADIVLKWTDEVAAEQGGPNVISIFTAVEEQLGLKLQSSKGPVDTLVIDHAEMPSEN